MNKVKKTVGVRTDCEFYKGTQKRPCTALKQLYCATEGKPCSFYKKKER